MKITAPSRQPLVECGQEYRYGNTQRLIRESRKTMAEWYDLKL